MSITRGTMSVGSAHPMVRAFDNSQPERWLGARKCATRRNSHVLALSGAEMIPFGSKQIRSRQTIRETVQITFRNQLHHISFHRTERASWYIGSLHKCGVTTRNAFMIHQRFSRRVQLCIAAMCASIVIGSARRNVLKALDCAARARQ